jgi:hypothetical protein
MDDIHILNDTQHNPQIPLLARLNHKYLRQRPIRREIRPAISPTTDYIFGAVFVANASEPLWFGHRGSCQIVRIPEKAGQVTAVHFRRAGVCVYAFVGLSMRYAVASRS